MAIEIERKLLLRDDTWREQANEGVFYRHYNMNLAKKPFTQC